MDVDARARGPGAAVRRKVAAGQASLPLEAAPKAPTAEASLDALIASLPAPEAWEPGPEARAAFAANEDPPARRKELPRDVRTIEAAKAFLDERLLALPPVQYRALLEEIRGEVAARLEGWKGP